MDKLQTLLGAMSAQQQKLVQLAQHGDNRSGTHEGCVDGHAVAAVAADIQQALEAFAAPPVAVSQQDRWSHLPVEEATRRRQQSRKNKRFSS
jgi:hypothetical protein